jgi:hypothetical protein
MERIEIHFLGNTIQSLTGHDQEKEKSTSIREEIVNIIYSTRVLYSENTKYASNWPKKRQTIQLKSWFTGMAISQMI